MQSPENHRFSLCLTHDVDRPYKTYQSLHLAATRRDPDQLLDLWPTRKPYWRFQDIMEMEAQLGVRSAFYFLNERSLFRDKPPTAWLRPRNWILYAGRYSLDDPDILDVIRTLDEGGWELGLHGSYDSFRDRDRLKWEKTVFEKRIGHQVVGGRQHYLNLDVPKTWRNARSIGLKYDSSLGSSSEYGFSHGYDPFRPFDDHFMVFPLTLMDISLPSVETDPERAWGVCEDLLREAREERAVMTVLWHPRYFNDHDHPNYADLYRRLIERAQDMGAWIGPPRELYSSLNGTEDSNRDTSGTSRQGSTAAEGGASRSNGRGA